MREGEFDRLFWAIPAKIKKEGEPYIYEGTFKQYSDRLGFEFHYQNGSTPLKLKMPLVDHKDGKTYMKFGLEYDQQFVVFFENHDWHLVMSDN